MAGRKNVNGEVPCDIGVCRQCLGRKGRLHPSELIDFTRLTICRWEGHAPCMEIRFRELVDNCDYHDAFYGRGKVLDRSLGYVSSHDSFPMGGCPYRMEHRLAFWNGGGHHASTDWGALWSRLWREFRERHNG